MVDAAIERWAAAGATAEQIAAMRAVRSASPTCGLNLGESTARARSSRQRRRRLALVRRPDAARRQRIYRARAPAAAVARWRGRHERIDLLTVLMHELGHQIGLVRPLCAPGESHELMYGTIGAGERRLPGSDDLPTPARGPVAGGFAFAPVSLGTIPAGQTVVVEFRHVIDQLRARTAGRRLEGHNDRRQETRPRCRRFQFGKRQYRRAGARRHDLHRRQPRRRFRRRHDGSSGTCR